MGTKQRIIDEVKIDVGLVPQSLASTNATGLYFPMYYWNKACFVCTYGPLATTGTVKLEVFQAKTIAGGSTALIATATATTNATEITHVSACKGITLGTFLAASTITITPYVNGVAQTAITYTAHATTTTIAGRQFSIAGIDTADAVEFLKCVNDAQYGTPGIYWTSAAGLCVGQAIDPWTTFTITCSSDDSTDVRTEPQGYLIVEVDRSAMSWSTAFYFLAAKVTTTATVLCGVTLIRRGRWSAPVQQSSIASVAVGY
jgi:hypothetical protein